MHINKYTEAGLDIKEISDKEEFVRLYNMINDIKIGKETDMSCEDNTTVYSFYLNDNNEISVEIECDWIILNGKRYLIK